jgi:hypothetical protein
MLFTDFVTDQESKIMYGYSMLIIFGMMFAVNFIFILKSILKFLKLTFLKAHYWRIRKNTKKSENIKQIA